MPTNINSQNYESIFTITDSKRIDQINKTIEGIKRNLHNHNDEKLAEQLQILNNWHELKILTIIQNMQINIIDDLTYNQRFNYIEWLQTNFKPLIKAVNTIKEPLIRDAIYVIGGITVITGYDEKHNQINYNTDYADMFQLAYPALFNDSNFRAPYDQILAINRFQMFSFNELKNNFDKYFQPATRESKDKLNYALDVLDELSFILETVEEYSLDWYEKISNLKNKDNLKFIQICIQHDLISLLDGVKIYEQIIRQYVKQQFSKASLNRQNALTNLPQFRIKHNWDVRNPESIEMQYPNDANKPNKPLNKDALIQLIEKIKKII